MHLCLVVATELVDRIRQRCTRTAMAVDERTVRSPYRERLKAEDPGTGKEIQAVIRPNLWS